MPYRQTASISGLIWRTITVRASKTVVTRRQNKAILHLIERAAEWTEKQEETRSKSLNELFHEPEIPSNHAEVQDE